MSKLPVLQITKDAYAFLFTETKKIFPMFVQYSTSIILLYIFMYLVKDQFASTAGAAPSAVATLILLTYTLLTFFLQMPMNISLVRATAKQEEIGTDFFNSLLNLRTRKTFLTMLAVLGIFSAFVGVSGSFILSASTIFLGSYFQGNSLLFSIVFLASMIPAIYIFSRFFLAVPSAALESEKPIRHSWKISKGHGIRILGIFLLTCLPSIAWGLIVTFLFDVSFQTNPLAYGLLTLPQLYFSLFEYAGLGLAYKHIDK